MVSLESLTADKMALADFVYALGSSNVNAETGIADYDGSTRQEAELLMSLLSSSPANLDQLDMDPISSSESEHSFDSSSSEDSTHRPSSTAEARRARTFRFTCPSLSLEHLECSGGRSIMPTTLGRIVSNGMMSKSLYPAALLERTLQVEDRDALRLSADAMAHNIRLTIQKAIQARIESWIQACSKVIVEKEKVMKQKGASKEELQGLLQTKEVRVIQCLQSAAKKILVTSAVTSFQIVGLCDSKDSELPPATKKQRMVEPSGLEEGDYHYEASYRLALKVIAALKTPAGFSEIVIDVPGTVHGSFLSKEGDMEELKSVVIKVNTKILAAIVEKSSRTIVRASVASMLENLRAPQEVKEEQVQEEEEVVSNTAPDLLTPMKKSDTKLVTAEVVRSALVTPARPIISATTPRNDASANLSSPMPHLWPLPDNFDGVNPEKTKDPRRVSPQPHVSHDPSVGQPSSFLIPRRTLFQEHDSAMVTPYVNESSKHYEDSENGPSLPLLVAAACQVMQSKR